MLRNRCHTFVANCCVTALLAISSTALFMGVFVGGGSVYADWVYALAKGISQYFFDVTEPLTNTIFDSDEVENVVFAVVSSMLVFLAGIAGAICIDDSRWRRAMWFSLFLCLYLGLVFYVTPVLAEEWDWTSCGADGKNCIVNWATYFRLIAWVLGTPMSLCLGVIIGTRLVQFCPG
jgi:hypothetical protein